MVEAIAVLCPSLTITPLIQVSFPNLQNSELEKKNSSERLIRSNI